jgi:hypothetical protein
MTRKSGAALPGHLESFNGTLARSWVYLILLAVFAGLFVWMEVPSLPYSAADFGTRTNGGHALDMVIGYTPAEAYELISGYGADGRAYYVSKLLINDTVFPVAYSLLFAATIALLLKRLTRPDSGLRYLALLPLAGGVLDLLGNAGLISLLLSYPARLDWLAATTGLITTVKLAVNGTSMLLIGACLLLAICQVLRKILSRARQDQA